MLTSKTARRATSLNFRVGCLLTLALIPLGLIAVLQSWSAIGTSRESYRESLIDQATLAAQPEHEAIVHAVGLARGLSNILPAPAGDPEGCVRIMQRTAQQLQQFSFVGVTRPDQTSVCNNFDRFFDFSINPDKRGVMAAQAPDVSFNPSGTASGEAVVIVSEPIRSQSDEFLGFVSLSFPVASISDARSRIEDDEGMTLTMLNADGQVLTTTGSLEATRALLPANDSLSPRLGDARHVFTAISLDGQRRDYALAPIVADRAYVLGIWDDPRLRSIDLPAILPAAGFPLLMWLASLAVAVLALRHQVIRPVRELRMRMRGFADGRAIFRANSIVNAPRELQEIGATFEQVANQVLHDEADLENKVHERDLLLREVHHRVKNNLQLMTSIINMQIREKLGPEAEDALRRVQQRLASLAKFHQDLYETSSLSKLRADQLLADLARQTVNLSGEGPGQVDLRMDFDEINLQPDQVGPLAMLVTEALTNAVKHARGAEDAPAHISVTMKRSDGETGEEIAVRIENSLLGEGTDIQGVGLGTRLIRAFASQLEGRVRQESQTDRYLVEVIFDRVA